MLLNRPKRPPLLLGQISDVLIIYKNSKMLLNCPSQE